MKKVPTLFLLTLVMGLPFLTATAQSDDKTVVDKYIASQAKREGGEEPDGIRKTVEGDLNRDGASDVAVLYTIEGQGGSNNYIQYLAVFVRRNGKLVPVTRLAVGGKNRREIEITSIKENTMFFDTTAYGPRDPSCCPTLKGHTTFVLVGSRLVEKHQK